MTRLQSMIILGSEHSLVQSE